MHYYKRNLGDYAKKAGRLSMLQHGAYTLLIDACYDREQFPTRDEAIDWTWASSTAEVEAVDFVLSKFFTLEDGRYIQKRIQEEIAGYHETSSTNKRIAAEREAKRKHPSTERARSVDEPPPNQEPRTNNQEPKIESAAAQRPSRPKREEITLATYLANCKADGIKPLPADHAIREYCRDAQITDEMLQVAWCVFRDDYQAGTNKAKRYKDWPGHFANAVRGGWYKLWFTDAGEVKWSSRGLTEKAVLDARAQKAQAAKEAHDGVPA